MDPQQVQVVGPQPPQAGLDRRPQVLARVPGGVRVAGAHGQGVLRSDHEPVAVVAEEAAHDLLGLPLVVSVGGVDEVAAGLGEPFQDAVGFLLVGPKAPGVPEAHRAKAQLGDPHAAQAQQLVAHRVPPVRLGLGQDVDLGHVLGVEIDPDRLV